MHNHHPVYTYQSNYLFIRPLKGLLDRDRDTLKEKNVIVGGGKETEEEEMVWVISQSLDNYSEVEVMTIEGEKERKRKAREMNQAALEEFRVEPGEGWRAGWIRTGRWTRGFGINILEVKQENVETGRLPGTSGERLWGSEKRAMVTHNPGTRRKAKAKATPVVSGNGLAVGDIYLWGIDDFASNGIYRKRAQMVNGREFWGKVRVKGFRGRGGEKLGENENGEPGIFFFFFCIVLYCIVLFFCFCFCFCFCFFFFVFVFNIISKNQKILN